MNNVMWLGRLIPLSELIALIHTDRWHLDIYSTEDEDGYLSIDKRFLCDDKTDEKWELKSLVLNNGERVSEIVGVKKEEVRNE